MVSLKVGRKIVFGTALGRLSKPLAWECFEVNRWRCIDGNGNTACRVLKLQEGKYHAEYTTPSIRLSAGPRASFLNLGIYRSLEDCKEIFQLHERCEAIPIFKPGGIVGWVDKGGAVVLYEEKSKIMVFHHRLFSFFSKMWQVIRSLISGKK